MSGAILLLSIFFLRENYDKYADLLNRDWLSLEVEQILDDLRNYYETHLDINEINLEEFALWFFEVRHLDYPKTKCKEYHIIFDQLSKSIGKTIPKEVLVKFETEETKKRIVEMVHDNVDIAEISALADEHLERVGQFGDVDNYVDNDLDRIRQTTDRSGGIKWKLPILQKSLGSMILGDFIVVAGYVDSGKSAFGLDQAVYAAQQVHGDGCVLWLNNEEPDDRMLRKLWKRALNSDWINIEQKLEKAKELLTKRFHGDINRVKLYNISGQNFKYIKKICQKNNPKFIVIDQLDNVQGLGNRDTAEYIRLGKLYTAVRNLAKEYAPILAITQTNGSTRWFDKDSQETQYQRVIDQSQLRGSSVDKQATSDIIITIGQDKRFPKSRFISIPKNKMEGSGDSLTRNIKGYEVLFDGNLCTYSEYTQN